MKTALGFEIEPVVRQVISDISLFDEYCKMHTMGTGSYLDTVYGEQTFLYSFVAGHLYIDFTTATILCRCDDIVTCDCDDIISDDFDSWVDYMDSCHERIVLTKKQAFKMLAPNLFTYSTQG